MRAFRLSLRYPWVTRKRIIKMLKPIPRVYKSKVKALMLVWPDEVYERMKWLTNSRKRMILWTYLISLINSIYVNASPYSWSTQTWVVFNDCPIQSTLVNLTSYFINIVVSRNSIEKCTFLHTIKHCRASSLNMYALSKYCK